jgi:hypothetical protein
MTVGQSPCLEHSRRKTKEAQHHANDEAAQYSWGVG